MTDEEFNKELLTDGSAPIFDENRKYFDKENIDKDKIYIYILLVNLNSLGHFLLYVYYRI